MKKKIADDFSETLVEVNRVTKVVKGGRNFSFSAGIVAGDKNGSVGYGRGKAKEVSEARTKASKNAKKKMMKVPLYNNRTIYHDVIGKSGAAKVVLRRAKPGTGVIAGGAMRAIFDNLGVKDIVAKSLGSGNASAMIAATFEGLSKLSSPSKIAAKRGRKPSEIFSGYGVQEPAPAKDSVKAKDAKEETKE